MSAWMYSMMWPMWDGPLAYGRAVVTKSLRGMPVVYRHADSDGTRASGPVHAHFIAATAADFAQRKERRARCTPTYMSAERRGDARKPAPSRRVAAQMPPYGVARPLCGSTTRRAVRLVWRHFGSQRSDEMSVNRPY